ncbi:cytochrome P450 [Sandaracinobacter sp. RS1-74]|uniref:cytochrome P450 n=1 Tax=Sandaracinobacteroides sayramensis TaxID=2913411 RepID=UPI001ED9C87D|nr:cytochrome P450 [Sandaracinobacteroides sayramensis]MCG2842744.1 cytochrome P450 [Sandaracinobacteroides sayramensis]
MSAIRRFMAAIDGVSGLGAAFLKAKGGFKARLAAVLGAAAGQRNAFAVLRFAQPRLGLGVNLVKPYPAARSLLLTTAADFREVIARQADFEVVYGPRMRKLTGGRDFFLGLQDGPHYRRDTAAMRAIVQPDDLEPVLAMARAEAAAALQGEEVDLPPMLSARIPARMVQDYFGVAMEREQLIADATLLFHYLFSDLGADPKVEAEAMAAKDRVNAAIDASVATAGPETLLGRAVAAGQAGEAAFDADGVRANIIGILIGAIPTLSKAACFAIDELLRRPAELAKVRALAAAGDEAGVAGYLWEALRFNPISPILYRRTPADVRLGGDDVLAGTMVLASNLSAMFDEQAVPNPNAFRAPRPWETYALWGEGLHLCWGDRINQAILPAMLTPLLAKPGLRALAPPDGEGTPFPRHYRLRFEA